MSVSVEPRRFGSGLAGDADTDQKPDSGATADLSPRTTRSRLAPGKPIKFGLAIGPALLLVAWIVTSATGVLDPKTLSAPWTVVTTAWELIGDGRLQSNLWTSVQRALIGGVIGVVLGLVLALAAGLSRIGEALIDGPVQIKRSIPTLALMPLAILWFGIGEEMKILLIALSVFVPVYINTYSALRGIDARYVELAETLDLSRAQFVRRIALPGALPGFFTGLRLAVTISWLALVVVEQVNASSGIGYLMYQARNYGMTEIIIVGLVVYAILGFGSDLLVRAAERKALAWRRTIGN
ncbi:MULTISPECIES: ABC transporter permease [Rhodococcus]|uniref:Nitrate ABC transporter permease n=3 Tax=Rhodococcus TaxID=1827 RepID=V9XFE7_9NOCA|nr:MULTISPECIES: ABC transporter permease [Rhodococcus]AHD22181.1 nitrate ABC transporter permease [Rhodococcus pyridinivorans SB3094]MCT7291605.1 ABC transporter permease [Rhodococcus sp. PAE-6]MCW3468832.1 ABC transporter permease [Rhodococcus pyridinivorans]QOV98927.1 ABC transporter permease [Rhodococcus pyridinivorans]QXF82043.1 ABC transporter permease [Rhodococcus pyridinivorans]